MPELAGQPPGALNGATADHEGAADANLDHEMQQRAGRRAATCRGDGRHRRVVARDHGKAAADHGKLDVAPSEHRGVEQARPRDEPGHGYTHGKRTAVEPLRLTREDPAQPREHRARFLAAVMPRGEQFELAVDSAGRQPPVAVAQVKSEHRRPLGMGI